MCANESPVLGMLPFGRVPKILRPLLRCAPSPPANLSEVHVGPVKLGPKCFFGLGIFGTQMAEWGHTVLGNSAQHRRLRQQM